MSYMNGKMLKQLREEKNMTQQQLADCLKVSSKTISKWETDRGLPDIGILSELAQALDLSVAELLAGEVNVNLNHSGNMRKKCFYVCPICGNVIESMGEGSFSCCGVKLPVLEAEEDNQSHVMELEVVDDHYYITIHHEMTKEHYISFLSYVTSDASQTIKLYPQQNAEGYFMRRGHGILYAYCNRHGLFSITV